MGENPPLTPPKEVRGKEKSSKEDPNVDEVCKSTGNQLYKKAGKGTKSYTV